MVQKRYGNDVMMRTKEQKYVLPENSSTTFISLLRHLTHLYASEDYSLFSWPLLISSLSVLPPLYLRIEQITFEAMLNEINSIEGVEEFGRG